jgi:hypothetical protein
MMFLLLVLKSKQSIVLTGTAHKRTTASTKAHKKHNIEEKIDHLDHHGHNKKITTQKAIKQRAQKSYISSPFNIVLP